MIPYWLQITAIAIGLVSGITGTALGVANLYLRWVDRKLILDIEYSAMVPLGSTGIRVINKSQREATVNRFCVEVESATKTELIDLSNVLFNADSLPGKIAAEDAMSIFPIRPLVYQLLKTHGHSGKARVLPIAEDGTGKLHKAKTSFYLKVPIVR